MICRTFPIATMSGASRMLHPVAPDDGEVPPTAPSCTDGLRNREHISHYLMSDYQ